MFTEEEDPDTYKQPTWFLLWDTSKEKEIKEVLYMLAEKPLELNEQLDYVAKIYYIMNKHKMKSGEELKGLKAFVEKEAKTGEPSFLPLIAKLALKLDLYFPDKKIPYVLPEKTYTIPRKAVSALLAGGFFGIYPPQDEALDRVHSFITYISSSEEIAQVKLKFYAHYFRSVSKEEPKGSIDITRTVCPKEVTEKDFFTKCTLPLTEIKIVRDIDMSDIPKTDIVDFANKFIGGGCMQFSTVQEEILFLVFPELFAARMINICMRPSEAIIIKGLQRFAVGKGYADTFDFDKPYEDELVKEIKDDKDCIDRSIIAIDAIYFFLLDEKGEQFMQECVDREIKKAIAGFQVGKKTIATGRWGCGAFKGCSQLKLLLQWIAISYCKRDAIFVNIKDETLNDADKVIKLFQEKPLNVLYNEILRVGKEYFKDGKGDIEGYNTFLFKNLLKD